MKLPNGTTDATTHVISYPTTEQPVSPAEASYRTALALDPTDATTHVNFGLWLRDDQDQGRDAEAEASYRAAISADPCCCAAHTELADLLDDLGRVDEAEVSYRCAIKLEDCEARAYIYFGMMLRELGRVAEAETCFRTATEIDPLNANAFYNLAHLLDDTNDDTDDINCNNSITAEEAYNTAIKLNPLHSDAAGNLALLLTRQHRNEEAIAAYHISIAANSNNASSHYNLANLYEELGRHADAEASYRCALVADPTDPDIHINLGYLLSKIHAVVPGVPGPRKLEALAAFRTALELGNIDDDDRARLHFEIELKTGHCPDRRQQATYVAAEFDKFAATFDNRLVEDLQYCAPDRIGAAIVATVVAAGQQMPSKQWSVVDFGAGTGLMGPILSPWARTLHGIDLSQKMLDVASGAGRGYDTLEVGDVGALRTNSVFDEGGVDLVVAADVLSYLGELNAFFEAVAVALRPGRGFLAVTAVALEHARGRRGDNLGGQGGTIPPPPPPPVTVVAPAAPPLPEGRVGLGLGEWELLYSGCYAHSEEYVRRVAASNMLALERHELIDMRLDFGKPVVAHLLVFRHSNE
jgi:predicted TPR repeat methyltransferase